MTTELTETRLNELLAITQKAQKYIDGPWFIAPDTARDAPDHTDSGLAMVETGRSDDWWVARLCEWPTAEHIAAFDPTTAKQLVELALEGVRLREAQFDVRECEHLIILGRQKHYCGNEAEHSGSHHCHCGFEWNAEG